MAASRIARAPISKAALAAALMFAAPASAETGTPPAGSNTAPGAQSDHERIICRSVDETGSRLRSNRVCMTRAQWDDQRRQDRALIERSQMQACTPGSGC